MIKKIVANPFQASGRLRDPRHFVGRESELRQILSRVANMDSVSVVGPRRIGKSSLLQHIVASGRQRLNESYHFHYLDLQPLDSDEEFYNLACEAIAGKRGRGYDDLKTAIEGKKIVLCIDEFEKSVEADFGAEFFDEMRSLAQTGNLALVEIHLGRDAALDATRNLVARSILEERSERGELVFRFQIPLSRMWVEKTKPSARILMERGRS